MSKIKDKAIDEQAYLEREKNELLSAKYVPHPIQQIADSIRACAESTARITNMLIEDRTEEARELEQEMQDYQGSRAEMFNYPSY